MNKKKWAKWDQTTSLQKFDKQILWKKIKKENIFVRIIVFLNFKQNQQNLTVYHIVFLHQPCVHSIWPKKPKLLFEHTITITLLKLSPRTLAFRMLALATIFYSLPTFMDVLHFFHHFFRFLRVNLYVCLSLESWQRFGARVMSYRSMWKVSSVSLSV